MHRIKVKKITKYKTPKNQHTQIIEFLFYIIKSQNKDSLIASLDKGLFTKYFKIILESKFFDLFICEYKNKKIGYALLVRKPIFLISEFKKIRTEIFLFIFFKLKLRILINLIIIFLKLDNINISKSNNKIIRNNINLYLLAIDKKYQSKGIGKIFLQKIFLKYKKRMITVESNNKRTSKFYVDKLNFKYLGKKIRVFKIQSVFNKTL